MCSEIASEGVKCKEGAGKVTAIYIIENRWNYREKVMKAMLEGNIKYINLVIKRGRMTMINL